MSRRKTTTEFIDDAIRVHGDRYDYSLVAYQSSCKKVKILCSTHGAFEQTPSNHLTGFGCLLCGLRSAGQYHKKSTASFVEEARRIHGDAYDYSKAIYSGAREKVTIICAKHGAFEQTSSVHLACKPGEACLSCSYEKRGARSQTEFDDFLKRAFSVHGDTYDYSFVEASYCGTNKNIDILCRTHGKFKQTPANHLRGEGCRKCSHLKLANSFRKSSADFISDARAVHGDRYDYSGADYRGAFDNVTIICPIDGPFKQTPTSHLSGIGCPKCSRRAQGAPRNLKRALRGEFDDGKPSYVYVVTFRLPGIATQLFKVGSGTGTRLSTTLNSIKRIGGYELNTRKLEFQSSGEAIVFEQIVHQQIRQFQFVVPSVFKFAGHSEVFTQVPDLSAMNLNKTLIRFRAGERWEIKRVGKGRYE